MCIVIIPHTAVFSIRTEMHETTMQNNGIRIKNTTDEHFNPNCSPAGIIYGHITIIREQPLHMSRVVGVAIQAW